MTTNSHSTFSERCLAGLGRGVRSLTLLGSAAAVVAGVGLTVVDPAPASAQAAPVKALAAEDFVQSIGVATHLTYGGTPYLDYPLVAQRLEESGIKQLRDGWGTGSAYASTFVRDTLGPLGIKITMVHDPRNNATPAQQKEMVKSQLLPVIAGAESLNEWDTRGAGWAGYARDWTIQMSRAYRSDPVTSQIPLIGPSMADTNNATSHAAMGDLSPYVDYGNTHDYPGDQYQMNDGIIDRVKRHVGAMVPGKPIQATETGFSNGPVDAPYPAMPEQQAAVVLPRLYLEHFRRGIARSFSYELFDEYPNEKFESRFGLLRHDGSRKPAFHAISALTKLLNDPGPAYTPGSLAYSLTGTDTATRQLLLQKRDGTFWLAVWQQNAVWDGRQVVDSPNRSVTLQLGSRADTVEVHGLDSGSTAPRATYRDATSVPLISSEDVTLVKLTGRDATAPSTVVPAAPSVQLPTPSALLPAPSAPATARVDAQNPSPSGSPARTVPSKLCNSANRCWESGSALSAADAARDLRGDYLCLVTGATSCTRGREAVSRVAERKFLSTVGSLAGEEAQRVASAWFDAVPG